MLVILLSNIVCRLFDSLHLIAGFFFHSERKLIGMQGMRRYCFLFFLFFQVKYCIWVVVNAEY